MYAVVYFDVLQIIYRSLPVVRTYIVHLAVPRATFSFRGPSQDHWGRFHFFMLLTLELVYQPIQFFLILVRNFIRISSVIFEVSFKGFLY